MHALEATRTGLHAMRRSAEAIVFAIFRLDLEVFSRIVNDLAEMRGQLITTGVGKSGIAARKIAATFSTCGIPAQFIHATDLLHGELGAVQENDTVLLVSNSGNTDELLRLMPHLEARRCTVAAIVGHRESCLGLLANALCTGAQAEVLNLPTASFAAACAVGDALAVAVATMKGAEIGKHHPGGAIGKTLTV